MPFPIPASRSAMHIHKCSSPVALLCTCRSVHSESLFFAFPLNQPQNGDDFGNPLGTVCWNGGGDGKVELCHDKQSWLKSQSQWLKLGFNPTTMLQHLLALVVTHDLEMNLNTIVTVMVAMATTFWCGFRCGVLWVKRKSVGKAKVVIYPKGKKYHCHSCKQPAWSHSRFLGTPWVPLWVPFLIRGYDSSSI